MKKPILLFILLLCVAFLHAQNTENKKPTLSNEEFFQRAELVFEGQFIKIVSTYDPKGTAKFDDCFRIEAYAVHKVYKGDTLLTGKTIYAVQQRALLGEEKTVYTQEPTVGDDGIITFTKTDFGYVRPYILQKHGINCSVNFFSPSIYFFTSSDFPDNENSEYSSFKKYKLIEHYSEEFMFDNNIMYVCGEIVAGLNDLVFRKREDFYNYMRQFEGFMVPEPKLQSQPEKQLQKVPEEAHYIDDLPKALSDSLLHEIYKEHKKDSKKKVQKKPKKNREDNNITFQIDNHQLIYDYGSQKHYVKFDILVSSNNPNIYFSQTALGLQYNIPICGTNIVQNEKVSYAMGEYFSNNYHVINFMDFNNTILLETFVKVPNPIRLTLSNVPTVFISVQIELLPNLNSGQSHIAFAWTNATTFATNYALSSDADIYDYYRYDNIFLINSNTISIATDNKPFITTHLNTLSKIAGISDTLTIRGYHFGNTTGSVYFKAADEGGKRFIKGLEQSYYIDWSDSLIKVKVPSMVYKGYENDTIIFSSGAGSGSIKIKTMQGDSCESASSLHIPYSVMNDRVTAGGTFRRIHLARKDCYYDFMFTLHSDYRHFSNMIAVIDTALRHWSEQIGLTLILERDMNNNLVFVDVDDNNKNIIKPFQRAGMTTTRRVAARLYNNDTILYRTTGSHISIYSDSVFWDYAISGKASSGKVSFYQAFMHEIGHVLSLNHVNDSLDLMYYEIKKGDTIKRFNSTNITAVKSNIAASQAINWATTNPSQPPLSPIGVKKPQITILNHAFPIICNNTQPVTLSSNYPTGNLWSTGATTQTIQVNQSGKYWLKFTDDVCEASADTVNIIYSSLGASFAVNHAICHGTSTGSIIANATGTHPSYTYHWTGNGINITTTSTTLTNLSAGTYYVEVNNSVGCTANYTVYVSQPEKLKVTGTIKNSMLLINVSGGIPPYTYQWAYYQTGGLKCLPIGQFVDQPFIPIDYLSLNCLLKLVITDANGCQIVLEGKEGGLDFIDQERNDSPSHEIMLFPNPASGTFTISNVRNATVYLYTALSELVNTFEHVSFNKTINVNHLPSGIYFLKIVEENTIKNEKLILNK